jgi:predicted outer membrane repeat protein
VAFGSIEVLSDNLPCSIIVLNEDDDGYGSLRDAVRCAVPGDTITFDANVKHITLTTGEIIIDKNLNIMSFNDEKVTISGNNSSRIFNLTNAINLRLFNLNLTQGHTNNINSGGAVLVNTNAELFAVACNFHHNNAGLYGGAIHSNNGNVEIHNCGF